MNNNWHENLQKFDTTSIADALQTRMMMSAHDEFTDKIVSKAQNMGMFNDGKQEIYGQWFKKMLY